jgi:FlaA1/EpsC-like NDP-sugar epimerase
MELNSKSFKDKVLMITGGGSFGNAVLKFLSSDLKEIRFSAGREKQEDMRIEYKTIN